MDTKYRKKVMLLSSVHYEILLHLLPLVTLFLLVLGFFYLEMMPIVTCSIVPCGLRHHP